MKALIGKVKGLPVWGKALAWIAEAGAPTSFTMSTLVRAVGIRSEHGRVALSGLLSTLVRRRIVKFEAMNLGGSDHGLYTVVDVDGFTEYRKAVDARLAQAGRRSRKTQRSAAAAIPEAAYLYDTQEVSTDDFLRPIIVDWVERRINDMLRGASAAHYVLDIHYTLTKET